MGATRLENRGWILTLPDISPAPTPARAAPSRTAAAFIAVTLIWGSTFLVIRIGNDTVPPVWAATLRLILAAAFLSVITLASGQRFPRGAALRSAALYGAFQLGLNFALVYWAETSAPSSLASVLFATLPISTALLGRLAGIERLDRGRLLGASIALGGIVVIFLGRLGSGAAPLPAAALVLATIVACIGTLLYRSGPRQPVVPANAVGSAVGAAVCFLASTLLHERHALPTTWAGIVPILVLAVAGSVGGFVLFTWLVTQWDATRAWFVSVLAPIVGLSLGYVVLGEQLGAAGLIGSGIVLAGVAIGLRARLPARPAVAARD